MLTLTQVGRSRQLKPVWSEVEQLTLRETSDRFGNLDT